jgi:hypothetical protein
VREEQGVWRTFYRVEEEGKGARKAVEAGRWSAAINAAGGSVRRPLQERKGARWRCRRIDAQLVGR